MSNLFTKPTEAQQFLLDQVASIFLKHHKWPHWQWLERQLFDAGHAPEETLRSMPTVGEGRPNGPQYSWIWFEHHTLKEESRVKLTMSSALHVPGMETLSGSFLWILNEVAKFRKSQIIDPLTVATPRMTNDDILRILPSTSATLGLMPEILLLEPPFWSSSISGSAGTGWSVDPSRAVMDFYGITALKPYVEKIAELYTPRQVASSPSVPSPLDVATSFDYFNTVWELHFKKPIVRLFNAERVTRLAYGVNSSDEFSTQLSTLGELLKNMSVAGVSGVNGPPLALLKAKLDSELSDAGGKQRASDAVRVLSYIADLRNALQHTGTEHRGLVAFTALGITYPVVDWADAWVRVQQRLIEALAVLRTEVQLLHERP